MKASLAIAAELRERIAKGELFAGALLPVESDLVEELGVSKGVVREALRILETEGLIEVRRGLGGGPRVRHPSILQATMSMGVYLQIGDVRVMDVWIARDRIIAAAIERLALQHTDADVAALQEAVNQLTALVGDFNRYYLQLIDVAETAVCLAGNNTEHVLVVALRHIIAAELEAATRDCIALGLPSATEQATAIEDEVAKAWAETARHVRLGRGGAARRAYERQAELIRNGISEIARDTTIVDVFGD